MVSRFSSQSCFLRLKKSHLPFSDFILIPTSNNIRREGLFNMYKLFTTNMIAAAIVFTPVHAHAVLCCALLHANYACDVSRQYMK
mmetsp:Transcript_8849/g.15063  ORF Transcript_8849/g.15063 Transcript_8849/m.15063 type:complete len:85 (+) Transcript_8849:846-1100(+)